MGYTYSCVAQNNYLWATQIILSPKPTKNVQQTLLCRPYIKTDYRLPIESVAQNSNMGYMVMCRPMERTMGIVDQSVAQAWAALIGHTCRVTF